MVFLTRPLGIKISSTTKNKFGVHVPYVNNMKLEHVSRNRKRKMVDNLDDINFDDLDMTTQEVDFDEMENDIAKFASEPSVRAVLEVGVDLQNYTSQIRKELEDVEAASIEDYLRQIPRVEKLHDEIITCDQVLESMEDLLVTFKGSLGQLSQEITSMQSRSQELNLKLENRKNLDNFLGEYTKQVAVSKGFSEAITNTECGVQYVKYVSELGEKLAFTSKKEIKNTPAAQESKAKLEQLRGRAAEKIRKWMITQIYALRDNFSEDQLSIQNSLLRAQPMMRFLKLYSTDVSDYVRNLYTDIISRIYLDSYKYSCKNTLKKMAQISMSPETIIPQQTRSLFKKRATIGESTLFFSLGERQKLLNDVCAPPTVFGDGSYPIEALLRSVYQKLIDHVTAEHAFASYFFDDDNICANIFAPTTKYLEQFFDDLLPKITDPICMILLLRINSEQKKEMQTRRCFKIHPHLTEIANKLINRFHTIVSNNITAIENADPHMFLEKEETAHLSNAMTKRFAEFATSLSLLLNDDVAEVMVPDMHGISASVIDLLERTSREFKTQELSTIFLLNNYCLILATLKSIPSCPLIELFQQKYNDCAEHFVDLQLQSNFKALFETIRRAFTKLESAEPVNTDIGEKELKEIALDFKENVVAKFKKISEYLLMKFGDFGSAGEILMTIAKRVVLYWAKFEQLCKSCIKGQQPPWLQSLVSHQLLVLWIQPITDSFLKPKDSK